MSDDEHTCLICLDPPKGEAPLFLLSCGCKVAWFHATCEHEWLSRISFYEGTPPCPVCKRVPLMKTNFSYSYGAGPAQEFFWQTIWLIGCELFISISLALTGGTWAVVLPIHSYGIILMPLLIPSRHDMIWFLQRIRIKIFFHLAYIFLKVVLYHELAHTNARQSANHMAFIGTLYCIVLLLAQINQLPLRPFERAHPFLAFAISREIKHSATALTKTVPRALKCLE